jgi:hypothetical protein
MFNTKVDGLASIQSKQDAPNTIRRTLLIAAGAGVLVWGCSARRFPMANIC